MNWTDVIGNVLSMFFMLVAPVVFVTWCAWSWWGGQTTLQRCGIIVGVVCILLFIWVAGLAGVLVLAGSNCVARTMLDGSPPTTCEILQDPWNHFFKLYRK